MGSRDPRIDAYIARSADFAKPILDHIRATVHSACPETEEKIKWGFPHFDYKGQMLCSMAAFKQHAAFGFWKGALVLGAGQTRDAMGSFGRLASLKDLPPRKALAEYIRKAMALNDAGVKVARAKKRPAPAPKMPADFAAALKRVKGAWEQWEAFPPSHRKEYLAWIVGAKQQATRERRMQTAVAQIREGKSQNWKYARK